MKSITAFVLGGLVVAATWAHAEPADDDGDDGDNVTDSEDGESEDGESTDDDGGPSQASEPEQTGNADSDGDGDHDETQQLTLPAGRWLVNAFATASLVSGASLRPLSLSPDVWYGVSDALSVGVVHSSVGKTGFVGGIGDSICVTGASHGCAKIYDSVAIDGRYRGATGEFAWAANAGLGLRALSPLQLAAKLGAVVRWHRSAIAVESAPALFLGLTNREPGTTGAVVNKETLAVPVTLTYSVNTAAALGLQTGLNLPFEDAGSAYSIPLTLGGHYRVSKPFSVTLAFSFIDLVGGSAAAGTSLRSLTLGVSYAP